MICNNDCDHCGAHDGNASPTFCKVMNAQIKAWDAMADYYNGRIEDDELE